MAKYRHRIFEMYEFRDEAIRALTPKSARPVTEASATASGSFHHLDVACLANAIIVHFTGAQTFGDSNLAQVREDCARLATKLEKDSQVIFDFTGVTSFSPASIEELVLLNQRLKNRGSRLALCCMEPTVHETFFSWSNGHVQRFGKV